MVSGSHEGAPSVPVVGAPVPAQVVAVCREFEADRHGHLYRPEKRSQGVNCNRVSSQDCSPQINPRSDTQIADVRFLGKILGDVIRAYGGDALFQRIEAIRAGSVDRYRGISNPRGLDAGLDTLTLDETVAFVRSFMLFSMLANLAEDRQGVTAENESTLTATLEYLKSQGVDAETGERPARQGADHARADRASHRGDAQEHDRPPESNIRAHAPARCRTYRNRGWRANRAGHREAGRVAVADACAATRAALCGG